MGLRPVYNMGFVIKQVLEMVCVSSVEYMYHSARVGSTGRGPLTSGGVRHIKLLTVAAAAAIEKAPSSLFLSHELRLTYNSKQVDTANP